MKVNSEKSSHSPQGNHPKRKGHKAGHIDPAALSDEGAGKEENKNVFIVLLLGLVRSRVQASPSFYAVTQSSQQ